MSRPTIALIFNPAARGDKAARFRKWLGQLPADVALLETFAPGSATGLARQAVKDGFRTVVASGGDGTINEVVNGLGQAPRALGQVRLSHSGQRILDVHLQHSMQSMFGFLSR